MKKLDPRAIRFFFLHFIARWFVVLFLFGIYLMFAFTNLGSQGSFLDMGISMGADALIVLFLLYGCAIMSYSRYGYELTDVAIIVAHGVMIKTSVTVPYNRIQDIIVSRGLADRLLGLADMHIRTAGTSISRVEELETIADARLPGLTQQDAEELRNDLLSRGASHKNTGV